MNVTVPAWTIFAFLHLCLVATAAFLAFRKLRKPRMIWVVGEFKGVTKRAMVIWVMKGAFTTRELALKACTGKRYFLVPVPVDEPIPEDGADLPRCEYPNAEAVNA